MGFYMKNRQDKIISGNWVTEFQNIYQQIDRTFLAPFAGVGTTFVTATHLQRYSIGSEIDTVHMECIHNKIHSIRQANSIDRIFQLLINNKTFFRNEESRSIVSSYVFNRILKNNYPCNNAQNCVVRVVRN